MAVTVQEELTPDFVRELLRKWDADKHVPIVWDAITVEKRLDWAGEPAYYIDVPLTEASDDKLKYALTLLAESDLLFDQEIQNRFGYMSYFRFHRP